MISLLTDSFLQVNEQRESAQLPLPFSSLTREKAVNIYLSHHTDLYQKSCRIFFRLFLSLYYLQNFLKTNPKLQLCPVFWYGSTNPAFAATFSESLFSTLYPLSHLYSVTKRHLLFHLYPVSPHHTCSQTYTLDQHTLAALFSVLHLHITNPLTTSFLTSK